MATTPEHAPRIPHIRLPDIKGAARWIQANWKPVGLSLAATALGLTGYFMATQDGGQHPPIRPTTGASDTIKPPESEFVVVPAIPTPTETPPTATASPPPKPTPTEAPPPTPTATSTSTPEAKKDVPCTIVPQEYCSQAEVIDLTNSLGQEVKLIGFNLPAGVPLTMPIDGQVAKVKLPEDATDNGFSVQIFDPNNPNPVWYLFKGDMQFDNMFSVNMKKGEVFGRTQNTGIKYRGHQFIFYIIRGLGKESTAAEDELEKMFPEAFTKPAIKVSASKESTGTTIITKTFYDTPPK